MITRKERAKQFMPFDAMKGLQEALRKQEEINSRVEKHEVCEEQQAKLSELLSKLDKGKITKIDFIYRYMVLGNEKIHFDDIYDLKIIEL